MQIIINIPEEVYDRVLKAKSTPDMLGLDIVNAINAIKNGKLLPKGHGKLFDENKLKKELIRRECSRAMYDTLDHILSYMKPIVKADKESE